MKKLLLILALASAGWGWNQLHSFIRVQKDGSINTFPQLLSPGLCVQHGKMYLAGGSGTDDVWESDTNGIYWRLRTGSASFGAMQQTRMISHHDTLWVVGGTPVSTEAGGYKAVWASGDSGATWTLIDSTTIPWHRRYHHTLVYDSATQTAILCGGASNDTLFFGDVWYSRNMRTWTKATSAAGWEPRHSFNGVSYNGRIYIYGAYSANGFGNGGDVWSASVSDLSTWRCDTTAAGWANRCCNGAVVWNNKMWCIAGYLGNNTGSTDLWFSSDGKNWTQEAANAGFSDKDYLGTCVLKNCIFAMAGYKWSTLAATNDVWMGVPAKTTIENRPLSGYKYCNVVKCKTIQTIPSFRFVINMDSVITDTVVWNHFNTDGSDICISDNQGSVLPRRIERFSKTGRTGTIYVSAQSYADTTFLKINYGKAAGGNSNSSAAITANGNFFTVYGMEDASGTFTDAAGNYNGTKSATGVTYADNGIVGKGVKFASPGLIKVGNTVITNFNNAKFVRIGGWFKNNPKTWQSMFFVDASPRLYFEGEGDAKIWMGINGYTRNFALGLYDTTNWCQVYMTYDARSNENGANYSKIKCWVNGAQIPYASTSGSGIHPDSFPVIVDTFRISRADHPVIGNADEITLGTGYWPTTAGWISDEDSMIIHQSGFYVNIRPPYIASPSSARPGANMVITGSWDTTGLAFSIGDSTRTISAKTDSTATITVPTVLSGTKQILVTQGGLRDSIPFSFFYGTQARSAYRSPAYRLSAYRAMSFRNEAYR